MTAESYHTLRRAVIEAGYGAEVEWAQTVGPPADPLALFAEYGWVVVNSGMKNQVAAGIWRRVCDSLAAGGLASDAFRHPGKAAALQLAWDRLEERFVEYSAATRAGRLLDWCESLPWIGAITKFHLAKNLGYDCAKPDRWLERVAVAAGETVDGLCARLAAQAGDRIATVDLVIWRACNLGLWGEASERVA